MDIVDTHCHVHFPDYQLDAEEVVKTARQEGVTRLLAVGCTLVDSELAIRFAMAHDNIWATIGLHPHEASVYTNDPAALERFRQLSRQPKVVAIGETGLDYHYMHSPKAEQHKLFRFQLEMATTHHLPLIFHVRDAFDDFWSILDQYSNVRGVVHSFSATPKELEQILARGLYVGVNGIVTFTKNSEQIEAYKHIPLENLLLETDAPFLTPTPYRGTICQPKHVVVTAEFLSDLRGETLEELARATTANAIKLFGLTS